MIYNATTNTLSSGPKPKLGDYQFPPDGPSDSMLASAEADLEQSLTIYRSSLIQCADECREKWKDGQEVGEGEYRLQHQMTTWKKEVWYDCHKEAYDRTMDDNRRIIAYPVTVKEAVERDYSKFYTYPETAKYMAKLLNAKPGDKILEPSAANGALIIAVKEYSGDEVLIYACELQEKHAEALKKITHWYVIADWLGDEISEDWMLFNCCIANPPFGNGVDLQAHFDKICKMVEHGGKIVMIVPEDFHPKCIYTTHPLQNWSTNKDGTTTPIKIIEFYNGSPAPAAGQETGVDGSAIEILRKLCDLKHYKDDVGKDGWYEENQPKIWAEAFAYIESIQQPHPPAKELEEAAIEERGIALVRLLKENTQLKLDIEQMKTNEYYMRCSWDETTKQRDALQSQLLALREDVGGFAEWISGTDWRYDDVSEVWSNTEITRTTADLLKEYYKEAGKKKGGENA